MEKELAASMHSRLLAPHLTALVTSSDGGRESIISIAWVMPVSSNPPLVAISVGKSRFSHELIKGSKEFVINVPPLELLEKIKFCGGISGRDVDKFKETGLTKEPSRRVKPPRIKECIAHLECKVVKEVDAGDHTIFVGEVLTASVDERAFDRDKNVRKLSALKPVFHLGGPYFSTSTEIVE